jgi:uncharacterized protein YoxC
MLILIKLVFFVALVNRHVQLLRKETFELMEKANSRTATIEHLDRIEEIFIEIQDIKMLLGALPKP